MRSRHTASKIQHPCGAKSLSQGLLGAALPYTVSFCSWRLIGYCDVETVCSVSLVLCDLFSKIISCRVKYFSSFFLNFHVYISLYLVSFSPQPSSHPSLAGLHLSPKKAPFHFYIKYLLFLSLPPFSSLNFAYTHMHAHTHE